MKDGQAISIVLTANVDLNGYDYHGEDVSDEIKKQIRKHYEEPQNIDISVMGASANLINVTVDGKIEECNN
jgi:hypothetical protein